MGLIFTIILLLLGILGAANLINAKGLVNAIRPYQNILGVVGFVIGVYWLIISILNLSTVTVLTLVTAGTMTALGLIMGISTLKAIISPSTAAKLTPYQGILGVIAIVLAILSLLS